MMVGKGLRFLAPTALALIVASQRQDIVRYLKISQLSAGEGPPGKVPARGPGAFPPRPGSGGGDGPGGFYSASPGGPPNTRGGEPRGAPGWAPWRRPGAAA